MAYYRINYNRLRNASLIAQGDRVAFRFDFDRGMLADLKARLGPADRKWDQNDKCWYITPQSINVARELCRQYDMALTTSLMGLVIDAEPVRETIRINYLGAAKIRDNGEYTSNGMDENGAWRYVFPRKTLYDWFGLTDDPALATSLYGVLGVRNDVTPADLKSAYRRLAKQWHPDVCHEPNAGATFAAIQAAYEVLYNPVMRGRYDFGLQMAQYVPVEQTKEPEKEWHPPLRCGYLDVTGTPKLGGLEVTEIHDWFDIVNSAGQTMIASWPQGGTAPVYNWR